MQEQTLAPNKSIAFVVFVKTPGLSPVKTRLAKGLGKELAEEFYKLSVLSVKEIGEELKKQMQTGKLEVLWAVAEEEGLDAAPGARNQCLFQGEGPLGERLANIYEQLKLQYDLVFFVGGDCPQIRVSDILTGVNYLQDKPCFVLGPAEDGGFWIWGGSHKVDKELWTQVSYSSASTCHELREKLTQHADCFELARYTDVDHAEDLKKLLNFFDKQEVLLPAQQTLLTWLRRNAR